MERSALNKNFEIFCWITIFSLAAGAQVLVFRAHERREAEIARMEIEVAQWQGVAAACEQDKAAGKVLSWDHASEKFQWRAPQPCSNSLDCTAANPITASGTITLITGDYTIYHTRY